MRRSCCVRLLVLSRAPHSAAAPNKPRFPDVLLLMLLFEDDRGDGTRGKVSASRETTFLKYDGDARVRSGGRLLLL